MSMLKSRLDELDRRVRESELFPRIRDAEAEMAKSEEEFIKRQLKRKKKRDEKRKGHLSNVPKLPSLNDHQDFFSSHVVNHDATSSKYLPFDEVFYPKLFNPITTAAPPHSIDQLWMLGFQHEAQRPKKNALEKRKEFKG